MIRKPALASQPILAATVVFALMRSLIAIDLVKFFGDRRALGHFSLDGVSLTVSPGQRIGLVGENGSGKTTLLRLLAGLDIPDSGSVMRPEATCFLHQELPFHPQQTVADVIAAALATSRALLDRIENPVSVADYGAALEQAELTGAWSAARRAMEIVHGLGLGAISQDRRIGTISGGQRSRLALAALLIERPSALLLDEPTNHLDDQAVSFVEDQLCQMPGLVLAASHDRVCAPLAVRSN